MATRILIVDGPELDRKALVSLIGASPDCTIVGDVGTVHKAITACRAKAHDVLVFGSRTPSTEGDPAQSVRTILQESPDTHILALVVDADQRCLLRPSDQEQAEENPVYPCCPQSACPGMLLVAGASCVLTRACQPKTLYRAIHRVAAGRSWFGAEAMRRMLECVTHHRPHVHYGLSARERQVAGLVAQGLCNKEIASSLNVGVAAIKKHIGHILTKLNVQDRLQLGLLVERNPDLARSPDQLEVS